MPIAAIRTKIMEIELSHPIQSIEGLHGYAKVQVLLRLHGAPISYVWVPVWNGRVPADLLIERICQQGHAVTMEALRAAIAAGRGGEISFENLFEIAAEKPVDAELEWPVITVAVCTRDRTEDLTLCLEAIVRLQYPRLDPLVVDNAPSSDSTAAMVRERYPNIRYVCESRPGLNWARNRAILEARGEIIAYADDDVIVDPLWTKTIAKAFRESPDIAAVTGLVAPFELETPAQHHFELYGGFGRGFAQKRGHAQPGARIARRYGISGQFGTGANMSFRREVFERVGLFDPALDVGTASNGGGDLEMFFRVLKGGYTLVYEPRALVWHRHRRDYEKLRTQLANNGVGLYAYFVRSMLAHRGERVGFLVLMIQWFFAWPLSNWIRSLLKPSRLPRELAWRELRGCFTGLRAYLKARRQAAGIIRSMGSQPALTATPQGVLPPLFNPGESRDEDGAIALRTVELLGPVADIDRVSRYDIVQVLFTRHRISLRHCCIRNTGQPIRADRLIDVAVTNLQYRILDPAESMPPKTVWATAMTALRRYLRRDRPADEPTEAAERLPDTVPVSVVLATFDRPADLERALQSLVNQKTSRKVAIIVVDNHPSSGLTKPVVHKFPGVVLVEEPRAGLAYARNAGFAACKGEIAIATDDDVTMPPDWIEKLVAPFARTDVMVVTGNVLPIELESKSQQIFESYGGLGRGFGTFEVDGDWFDAYQRHAVPTWRLGATANAAFRCSVFDDSRIGLMDEALGPGMPSGVGEDTYLFYKVLKAGYTICYEPAAYVWHTHRRDMPALRRQLWGYGKGGPSYHLTTFARDGDWRGLYRIFIELPKLFWCRFKARLRRWNEYPLSLLWLELRANLIGPWAWWKSYRRVKREGKSAPYRQVAERSAELFGTGV